MPTYSNMTPIIIPDSGQGIPYPSNIVVSSPFNILGSITVTLHNLTHTFPEDIRLLLVSPSGDNEILMMDQGGGTDLTGIDITFDDNAAQPIPKNSMLDVSASYKPLPVTFQNLWLPPAPMPQLYMTPSQYNLSGHFAGKNPNGIWSLYVLDTVQGEQGVIAQGWSINLSFVPCLYPETKVQTISGLRKIKELRKGDYVIDVNGNSVELVSNLCFETPVKRFVKIPKGSLGVNKPDTDLYITRDHMILYEGKQVTACSLINDNKNMRKRIRMTKVGNMGGVQTYSLCTKEKCFVMMQNVPVETWSEKDISTKANKYLYKEL